MRIVAISDTHGMHRDVSLPEGDVLVHTGDLTMQGDAPVIEDFVSWFAAQSFQHKIFIAGNHDFWAESEPLKMIAQAQAAGVHYLCETGVEVEGTRFWGSPYTPEFMRWAFMLSPGSVAQHWLRVPANIDVLLTHGPPKGVLDEVVVPSDAKPVGLREKGARENGTQENDEGSHVGCSGLLQRVRQLGVPVHVFGHIHEGYGTHLIDNTRFFNASLLDNRYQLANRPVVIDIEANSVTAVETVKKTAAEISAGTTAGTTAKTDSEVVTEDVAATLEV